MLTQVPLPPTVTVRAAPADTPRVAATTSPIVEVSGLVKRYGARTAVDGVSFAVLEGEIFGLLGPNGAGKSTTLGLLSTQVRPDAGHVRIAGHDVAREPRAVQPLIGIVPQDFALYQELTARDNLTFFGQIYGLHGATLRARVDEAFETVGLSDRADRGPVAAFSGGMKRRLNIAAGLLHRPRVLFLDEPTVGVDPQSRNFIFEHVRRLNEAGTTVIYTTHYMEEAQRLCHRVAILDQGRLLALDTPAGLIGLLDSGAVPAHTVETYGRNLETVFLHLTGGQLRD